MILSGPYWSNENKLSWIEGTISKRATKRTATSAYLTDLWRDSVFRIEPDLV